MSKSILRTTRKQLDFEHLKKFMVSIGMECSQQPEKLECYENDPAKAVELCCENMKIELEKQIEHSNEDELECLIEKLLEYQQANFQDESILFRILLMKAEKQRAMKALPRLEVLYAGI